MEINLKKFGFKIEKINSLSNESNFWPVFIAGFALILALSFGPPFIELVKADTNSVRFTATVGATLSFTIDATIQAFGTITANTPKFATTTLYINSSNVNGTNTTVNRASTTNTLFAGGQYIPDIPNNNNWTAPGATSTAGASAVWTIATTKGLGFRVMSGISGAASTTCGGSTTWWGTDDGGPNSKWSGVSTSTAAQQIANCNYYKDSVGQTVIYQIDVAAAQAGGDYHSSPIVFTVTTN